MTTFRVAASQQPVHNDDINANVIAIRDAIDFAHDQHADVLLTPEGSLSGYKPDIDQKATETALVDVTGYAKDKAVGLALGTCFIEPEDGQCYNQLRIYEPDGSYLGFHAKTLRCGTMETSPVGEINHYAVKPLRTFTFRSRSGPVTIGGLICNDMWANPMCTPMPDPHLSQQLSQMGAKVILHAVNGGSRGDGDNAVVARMYHEANLRMRARAGQVWIVSADNSLPESLKTAAPSGVINPEGEYVNRPGLVGTQHFASEIAM